MKKFKSILCSLLVVACCGLMFAGCGNKPVETTVTLDDTLKTQLVNSVQVGGVENNTSIAKYFENSIKIKTTGEKFEIEVIIEGPSSNDTKMLATIKDSIYINGTETMYQDSEHQFVKKTDGTVDIYTKQSGSNYYDKNNKQYDKLTQIQMSVSSMPSLSLNEDFFKTVDNSVKKLTYKDGSYSLIFTVKQQMEELTGTTTYTFKFDANGVLTAVENSFDVFMVPMYYAQIKANIVMTKNDQPITAPNWAVVPTE